MLRVYLIPAMGCNYRLYADLHLEGYDQLVLDWEPHGDCKTLAEYAVIMAKKIDQSKPFVLAGISMGGMMAMELSKIVKPEKIILMSSARGRNELPGYVRFAGKSRIYKIIPAVVIKFFSPISVLAMSIRTKAGRKIFYKMLREREASFLKFSIHVVCSWTENIEFENLVHFHGNKDLTLPLRRIKNYVLVKGMGHASMLDDWTEMQNLILGELDKMPTKNA